MYLPMPAELMCLLCKQRDLEMKYNHDRKPKFIILPFSDLFNTSDMFKMHKLQLG